MSEQTSDIHVNPHSRFFEGHSALVDKLHAELNKATGPVPDELHHYTNAPAVLQILQQGELWASNALFLNDAYEVEWGLAIYSGIIAGTRNAKGATHSKRVLDLLDASALHAEMLRQSSVFVCCLSAAESQLSQWRAYCGRTGSGYSIGLSTDGLKAMRFGESPISFRRVLYEREEQSRLVLETVAAFAAYIDFLPGEVWERDKPLLNEFFTNWLHSLLIGMKGTAFSEEKEWRLVYRDWDFGKPKYSFRTSRSGTIVPYCALQGSEGQLPLTRVIVGPTNHPEIETRSMQQLLRKCGYADIDVQFCDIPFREL